MNPDLQFRGTKLFELTQPMIYGWRRGDQYLYIGKTINGLRRVLTHTVIDVVEPVLETDDFDFWYVNLLELDSRERELIHLFKPKYNQTLKEHKIKLLKGVAKGRKVFPEQFHKIRRQQLENSRIITDPRRMLPKKTTLTTYELEQDRKETEETMKKMFISFMRNSEE